MRHAPASVNPRSKLPEQGLLALRYLPAWLQRLALKRALDKILARHRAGGELDFLMDRWVSVQVRDLGYDWRIGLGPEGFRVEGPWQRAEAVVRAGARDFLAMAAHRQDPDTLFFQRRLELEGDTELGLAVKNLLDGLDDSALPPFLRQGMNKAADWLAV